jgi:hypothetical protein
MAEQFVKADLNLKGGITVLLVCFQITVFDKRNRLVRCFRGEDVAKRYVLETKVLPNIIVIGNVNSGGDTVRVRRGRGII